MDLISLGLSVDSKGVEQGVNRLNKLDRSGTKAEQSLNRISGAATAMGAAVVAAIGGVSFQRLISETADFEQSLLGLKAVSGATAQQMKQLEDQARTLGATSQFSAKQAADAQRFLAQAGFSVNETLSATPGILNLATAAQLDLGRAADIASNILGGMRLEVSELNRVNDVLAATAGRSNTTVEQLGDALSYAAPIAAAAGVSIEEASSAIGVLSDAGLQGSRAGTGLLGVIRQVSNVTPKAAGVLESYGLSIADVNVESEGLGTVLERLRDANLSTADAFAVFGSEAGPAAQILADGAARSQEMAEGLRDVEGAAAEMAQTIGSGLTGSMRSFNSMLSESILSLGRDQGVAGGFQEVIDTATGVLAVYNDLLPEFAAGNDLTEEQTEKLRSLASSLEIAGDVALGVAVLYAGRLAGGLASAASQMVGAARSAGVLRGAIAALGGPVGLLIGAGGLLYAFREELGLVEGRAESTANRIRELTQSMREMSAFDLSQRLSSARNELTALIDQGQNLKNVLDGLSPGDTWDGRTYEELREQYIGIRRDAQLAKNTVEELEDAIDGNSESSATSSAELKTLDQWLFKVDETTQAVTASTSKASEEADGFASSLESLRRQLDPAYASQQDLSEATSLLDQGLQTGAITLNEYLALWDKAAESFIGAGDASEEAKDETEGNVDAMATAVERGVERMDDAFVDSWRSILDGSESTFDAFKDIALDTLAEIIHAYTTRQITASLGLNVQGSGGASGSSGALGGGGGFGGLGDIAKYGKQAYDYLFGGATASSAGASLGMSGGVSAAGINSANAVAGGSAAASGGALSSLSSFTSVAGPYYALASLGNQLYESAGLYDALGIKTGGDISNTLGMIAPIGGTIIGAGLDAVFGSKYSGEDPTGILKTVNQFGAAGREGFEREAFATGALGDIGFARESRDIDSLFGDRDNFENAKKYAEQLAQIDNVVARLATSEAELNEMREAAAEQGLSSMSDLEGRYDAILGTIDGDFGEFVRGLEGDVSEIVPVALRARDAFSILSDGVDALGLQFNAAGAQAYEAAGAIAEIAGGVQNLASLQSSYYQEFFTEEERRANLAESLGEQFDALNLAMPETRDGFRALVEAQNLNTQAGREMYVELLNLAPAFGQVAESAGMAADASRLASRRAEMEIQILRLQGRESEAVERERQIELDTLDDSLDPLQERIWLLQDAEAQQAQATSALESANSAANDALSDLEQAAQREQEQLRDAHEARMAAYEEQIRDTESSISDLERVSSALESALSGVRTESRALDASRLQSARARIAGAASAGGAPDIESLSGALGAVGGDTQQFYSTFEDYARAQSETSRDINALNDATEDQISIEERTLRTLESQQEREQVRFERRMEGLDAQLESYQRQINAILGVDESVMSLEGAIASVESAIGALQTSRDKAVASGAVTQTEDEILAGALYNERYPDVAQAVAAGEFINPRQHYEEFGREEGRDWPAFANGGMHDGGWRVVGERGPELEWTPPSRIMSNQASSSMLNTEAVRQAVDTMRNELGGYLRGIMISSDETASLLDDWDTQGQPATRDMTTA